MATIGNRNV